MRAALEFCIGGNFEDRNHQSKRRLARSCKRLPGNCKKAASWARTEC
nr:MAG TPA: L-lysine epsilon oxidase C-terminal domain [Caudoviricetes sp.]